MQENSIHYLS